MSWRSRSRVIGAELRKRRKERRMSMRSVGEKIGKSESTVARWETGELLLPREDLLRILGVLGLTGPLASRLLELVDHQDDPTWYADLDLSPRMQDLIGLEERASEIWECSIGVVPGLLQVPEYAAATLSAFVPPDVVASRAHARAERQRVLADTTYTAVIDEAVLHRPIGGPHVMAAQLEHLLESPSSTTVLVVPMSAGMHPALTGSFTLLNFATGGEIVYTEHQRSSTIIDAPRSDIEGYVAVADTLRSMAMSPDESARLIADRATAWKGVAQ